MVLGVQHMVGDALPLQQLAQQFTLLNGNGAHQHRLALFMAGFHLLDNGPVLARLGLVHHVRMVHPDHRLVGGNLHHIQLVNGGKFLFFRQRRTGHAGELVIQPEEVLEGNGGQGLALPCHGDPFLGLDGLVQALVVPPAVHQTSGELVHNDDFPVLDHIVDVLFHQAPGLHGLVDVVAQGGVLRIRQILHAEELLRLFDALGGQGHGAGLFIHEIVAVVIVLDFLLVGLGKNLTAQGGHKLVRPLVQLGRVLSLAGDDQRGPGLVNEDGVHLVHDGKGVAPLNQLLLVDGHVVPQVVKAQLVVGAVSNVRGVSLPALGGSHAGNHQANGQTQIAVDLTHPLGLIFGQVVVDSDHMDPFPGQGIQIAGQNGHQGFAFTGLHFSDPTLMQNDAAHKLHRIGPQAQHPVRRLPHGGESLRQQVIQGLPLSQPLLELGSLAPEFFLAQGLIAVLQGQNLIHQRLNFLDFPLGAGAEQFIKQSHCNLLQFPIGTNSRFFVLYHTFVGKKSRFCEQTPEKKPDFPGQIPQSPGSLAKNARISPSSALTLPCWYPSFPPPRP